MSSRPAAALPPRVVPRSARRVGIAMGTGVAADLVLGVATLFAVPFHRHTALAPVHGRSIYLAHALLGVVLGVVAVGVLPRARHLGRLVRIGAVTGLVGLGIAGAGGLLAVEQPTRLLGMALMLAGSVAAVTGYLMPLIDSVPSAPSGDVTETSTETA